MKSVCFYNHWHNGDCFHAKGWIQSIMQQHPECGYVSSHSNHPSILADLCEHLDLKELPPLPQSQRIVEQGNVIFVNTWCGAYGSETFRPGEIHANWLSLHKQFKIVANYLNQHNGMNIVFSDNVLDYIPTTDWDYYHTEAADSFLAQHLEPKHLLCNGLVRSTQSNIGDMKSIVETLAEQYAGHAWICTKKFETSKSNIYFTDDIFNLESDINEIVYLSTKCKTIVGKNSGPFMFTHIRENIMDQAKTFVSLSHRYSDSYVCDVDGILCQYRHCSSDEDSDVLATIKHPLL